MAVLSTKAVNKELEEVNRLLRRTQNNHRYLSNRKIEIEIDDLIATQADNPDAYHKVKYLQAQLIPDVISVYHDTYEGDVGLIVILTNSNRNLLPKETYEEVVKEAAGKPIFFCMLDSQLSDRLLYGL